MQDVSIIKIPDTMVEYTAVRQFAISRCAVLASVVRDFCTSIHAAIVGLLYFPKNHAAHISGGEHDLQLPPSFERQTDGRKPAV